MSVASPPPGSQRRVYTALSEYKRSRTVWQSLREEGFTTLTNLSNAVLQQRFVDHHECWHPSLQPFAHLREKFYEKMQHEIDVYRVKAEETLSKLERQCNRIKEQHHILVQMRDELVGRFGVERVVNVPVLVTMRLDTLVARLWKAAELHAAQLALDRQVVEQLVHIEQREQATLQLSIWLNEPAMRPIQWIQDFDDQVQVETAADAEKV